MTAEGCEFTTDSPRWCTVHQSPIVVCTYAAQALQQEVTRLVGANEHWHTRVKQLKLETDALQRRVAEAEEQLNEARKALGSWMKDYETVRGAILNLRQAEMTAIGNNEEYQSRLASLEAQNAVLRRALEDAVNRMDPDESGLQRAALSPPAGEIA